MGLLQILKTQTPYFPDNGDTEEYIFQEIKTN